MTPDRTVRAVEMLQTLRQDCLDDAAKRDGQPLTGPNVAVWLGEMGAQIAALADVLIVMLETPVKTDPVVGMFTGLIGSNDTDHDDRGNPL